MHWCILIESVDNDLLCKIARILVSINNISAERVLNLSDKQHVIHKGTLIGTCKDTDWMRRYQDLITWNISKDA